MSNIGYGLVCIGLAALGFHYNSAWAFVGSVLAFMFMGD